MGDPVFYWMAENNDFANLHSPDALEAVDEGVAVIGLGDHARFEELVQKRACQCQEIARVRSKVDPLFIRADLRDLRIYEFRCGDDLARAIAKPTAGDALSRECVAPRPPLY